MFQVENQESAMTRGDTGSVKFKATGYEFAEGDRALFTVKSADGTVVKQEQCEIDENGEFTIYFTNAETDYLSPGSYSWDVRFVIHPYYNDQGAIVSGDHVHTPFLPKTLTLLPAVGDI